MKRVYLIRHGLPDFPGGKRMCLGITDIPLGEAGLAQAAQMAARLPPVTSVFSSPLIRAVQTAKVIGQNVTVLEGLRELSFGQWDGQPFDRIRERFPELYAARGTDPTLLLPEQEDPAAGLARFRSAMEDAAGQSPGDFAVVAHGGIIALFLQSIGGSRYKPDYAEIISLYYDNGTFLRT
ncbi:MAG: histidine phosphatase family protein [Oscillospiraceae bacterium]|nr:histidine phosphatase family protein [Oscillospiraceae bacterium]